MTEYFFQPGERAVFDPRKATKADLVRGGAMMLGLNCLEAGQSRKIHAQTGADKFYLILSGNASMIVGISPPPR